MTWKDLGLYSREKNGIKRKSQHHMQWYRRRMIIIGWCYFYLSRYRTWHRIKRSRAYCFRSVLTSLDLYKAGCIFFEPNTFRSTFTLTLWLRLTPVEKVEFHKQMSCLLVFRSQGKGVMVPPVLIDVNKDGVMDILMNSFNGVMVLYDGETLAPMWKLQMEERESYR